MKIIVKKDGEGYLAEVEWYENVYAYWNTEFEAKKELLGVVEMMTDFHIEQLENDRKIKKSILETSLVDYAV